MSLPPATNAPPDGPQALTLRYFTLLRHRRPDWAGALIVNVGLGPAGAALSLASNAAGAVCLSVEADPALLREAGRTGSCDFVVNSLDEALRAAKNEIRRGRPLSVALEGDPGLLLEEMLERGLAPQLFAGGPGYREAALRFQSVGAILLDRNADAIDATAATGRWRVEIFRFETLAELRSFDSEALALLPAEDTLRRTWLQSVGRLFPRDRTRSLWLTAEEAARLRSMVPGLER
jgi:urocanate hydratase